MHRIWLFSQIFSRGQMENMSCIRLFTANSVNYIDVMQGQWHRSHLRSVCSINNLQISLFHIIYFSSILSFSIYLVVLVVLWDLYFNILYFDIWIEHNVHWGNRFLMFWFILVCLLMRHNIEVRRTQFENMIIKQFKIELEY